MTTDWIAFRSGSQVGKPTYLRRHDGMIVSWTYDPQDAAAFPTKREALAALRELQPNRVWGIVHNAVRRPVS